jgi:hypothetical protein
MATRPKPHTAKNWLAVQRDTALPPYYAALMAKVKASLETKQR